MIPSGAVGMRANDVLLDIGCGDGRVLTCLCKIIGCRGIGIDVSEVRVKHKHASTTSQTLAVL
jgi:cyclopropane fatty-acyl-phospholipid synthase-like methyltransferase